MTRVRLSFVIVGLSLSVAGIAAVSSACSAELTPAPADPEPRFCDPGVPVIPCDAGAPGAPLSCTGDPKATTDARNMPRDRSFGVGCRSYFPARDCSPISNCYCREDDNDAGTASWTCER